MINDIVTKVADVIAEALPDYTRVDTFFTNPKKVDSADYPMAMLYDPEVTSKRLREQQKDQTIVVLGLLVRKSEQGPAIRDDLDAVAAAFDADPLLSATVDDALVTDTGSAEGMESHTAGGIVIEVRLVA